MPKQECAKDTILSDYLYFSKHSKIRINAFHNITMKYIQILCITVLQLRKLKRLYAKIAFLNSLVINRVSYF